MSIENGSKPPAVPPRTNNQIRASAGADGLALKKKWKSLLPDACARWEKVPTEELASVDGNIHRLAGLVQMRYRLDREEANRQVRAFFDQHEPAA